MPLRDSFSTTSDVSLEETVADLESMASFPAKDTRSSLSSKEKDTRSSLSSRERRGTKRNPHGLSVMSRSGYFRTSTLWGQTGSSGARHGVDEMDEEYALQRNFIDANSVKEMVRAKLHKHAYDVSDHYKPDSCWTAVATSLCFEQITLGIIAINAIWIAVDTDLNKAPILIDAHPVFQVVENAFCTFFVSELLIRIMAFQNKLDAIRDAWFVFDSVLVISMVAETWVMTIVALSAAPGQPAGSASGMGNASIVRTARLLRLTRMARLARLLRAMPELMIMIKGMMAATRSVFFTFCLLVLIIYVFAVAFTQITSDSQIGDKYFATVPKSMGTLLLYGTLLDDIGRLVRDLSDEAFIIAAVFMLFVTLAALTVMNMLIGVLCEVVSVVAAIEKEEMLLAYVTGKLQKVVSILDVDGDNTISKKEFLKILDNVDAVRCLSDVGVDVVSLVDFADFIFEKDPLSNEAEGELSFAKFTEVVLQFRGTNNATVKDIVDLRRFVRNAIIETHKQLANLLQAVQLTRTDFRRGATFLSNSVEQIRRSGDAHTLDEMHTRRSGDSQTLGDDLPKWPIPSRSNRVGLMKSCVSVESEAGSSPKEGSRHACRTFGQTLDQEGEEEPQEANFPTQHFNASNDSALRAPQASAPVNLLRHGVQAQENLFGQGDVDATGLATFPTSLRGQWYPCHSADAEPRTAWTEMFASFETSRSEAVPSGPDGQPQVSHEGPAPLSRPFWSTSTQEQLTVKELRLGEKTAFTSASICEAGSQVVDSNPRFQRECCGNAKQAVLEPTTHTVDFCT